MTGGYDPAHFERLFQVEDRHFWVRARNEMIFQLAQKAVSAVPAGYRALEVGCGDGNVLRHLKGACRQGIVTGMDYFAEGLVYSRRRGVSALVQGDIARPPFGRVFQLIGVFDVLEHLADDGRALLRPAGNARARWNSSFDRSGASLAVEQLRQSVGTLPPLYKKEEFARKLGESGYHIEFLYRVHGRHSPVDVAAPPACKPRFLGHRCCGCSQTRLTYRARSKRALVSPAGPGSPLGERVPAVAFRYFSGSSSTKCLVSTPGSKGVSPLPGNSRGARSQRAVSRLFSTPACTQSAPRTSVATWLLSRRVLSRAINPHENHREIPSGEGSDGCVTPRFHRPPRAACARVPIRRGHQAPSSTASTKSPGKS